MSKAIYDNGPIRAVKQPAAKWQYVPRHLDSLLHQLIELNPERAKQIIAKLAEDKRPLPQRELV